MRTTLPPVHLDLHSSWFDLLIGILDINADKYCEEDAEALKTEIMRYARSFVDSENELCADVRLYPRGAERLIWQLLKNLCFQYDPEHSYCAELTEKGTRRKLFAAKPHESDDKEASV